MENPATNLARAGLGQISEKWLDSVCVGAEIWYNRTLYVRSCAINVPLTPPGRNICL